MVPIQHFYVYCGLNTKYESRRGRSRGSRGSPSIWNIVETNRQVFTPLHSNVSNWVRAVFDLLKPSQKNIFFDTVFDTGRNGSNPTRNTNVHELRQEHLRIQTWAFTRFTRFTFHLEHSENQ